MTGQSTGFVRLGNRRSVRLEDVPQLTIEVLRDGVSRAVANGWRIVTFFGTAEGPARLRLIVVVADDERGHLGAASAIVGERYPAIAAECAR